VEALKQRKLRLQLFGVLYAIWIIIIFLPVKGVGLMLCDTGTGTRHKIGNILDTLILVTYSIFIIQSLSDSSLAI